MYQRTMTGEPNEHTVGMRDLGARETWVVAPLIAIIIGLGVFPQVLLDVIDPAVGRTMQQVGVSDPEPAVPAAEGGSR
jgi:NADH-quinone oxidoreductase subunit M